MENENEPSKECQTKEECFKVPPNPREVEKQQEQLLVAKYGSLKAKCGGSLLKKRMANKGPKYFDSGDYNMAKAEMKKQSKSVEVTQVTGNHMPTVDELSKVRKHASPTLTKQN
ncbi:unnamed protein product [Clavelina lepadiformis]|uniref:cAMP-regulated phosphoprotein 19 n=1 Tax=Clavelina lepadiformis TaxID=159417 RepID=A0ABP0FKR0_CLALP